MTVTQLGPREEAALRAAPFTYAAVGALSDGHTPVGFTRLRRSRTLRRRDFDAAAAELMAWRMQAGAGLRVEASDVPLRADTVVVLHLGRGPVSVHIPCRVVEVVDEPGRRGFSYGTLPGHPEAGEEQFLLELRDDGRIQATVTAFSQPASLLTRLAGPLGQAAQRLMAGRYLAALDSARRP